VHGVNASSSLLGPRCNTSSSSGWRTWGWLGPSGSLCNELFIHSFGWLGPRGQVVAGCSRCHLFFPFLAGRRGSHKPCQRPFYLSQPLTTFKSLRSLWTAVRCRPLAVNRLHGLPCNLCGGWAIVGFSTLVPFQLFKVGLVTAPCSSLLHPFPSQRFVAT
jgi:hypothetical protein